MDILRKLSGGELERAYESVFREAFPPEELKPLSVMRRMTGEGQYDPLGFFRDGRPVGYICCWKDLPYILIDYLCVDRRFRNGGVGAAVLEKTRAFYPPDTVFIGEVEAPTGDGEADRLIKRRLGFYARCGAQDTGWTEHLFDAWFRILVLPCPGCAPIGREEAVRQLAQCYRRSLSEERWRKFVRFYRPDGNTASF